MSPEKVIKYSLTLFVFAIVSRSIEAISFFYYAVPVLCVFFIGYYLVDVKSEMAKVKSQKNKNGNDNQESGIEKWSDSLFASLKRMTALFLVLIPGIWFLLTSLWSSYPTISAERAFYFILISIGCISAGMLWRRYSNKGILDFLLPTNIFVVLLCLFSLVTYIPADSWTGGNGKGFMGFFGQQNQLASIILFTMPAAFGLKIKNKSINIIFFYFLLLTSNLLLLLLTYSRASILSLVIGAAIFLIINKNWKIISYSFGVIVLLTVIIFLNPTLKNYSEYIINKDFPEFYSSRIWMWEPSYQAALNGGLVGLGYGISDPNIKPGSLGDHYENGRFVREKGNSILALVEETGIVGLVLFILPIFFILRKFRKYNVEFRIKDNNYAVYILLSALTAFIIHAQFEAWWVGVGSVQLPLFFLYLGLVKAPHLSPK